VNTALKERELKAKSPENGLIWPLGGSGSPLLFLRPWTAFWTFRLELEQCFRISRATTFQAGDRKELWLRWPRASDAEAFVRLAGDPEVAKQTANIPYPYEPRHAETFIVSVCAENASGAGLSLVMAPKRHPDEAIGNIVRAGSRSRGVATLGFWLGRPFWGRVTWAKPERLSSILYLASLPWAKSRPPHCRPIPVPWSFRRELGFAPAGRGD